jgi:polygalacturonase
MDVSRPARIHNAVEEKEMTPRRLLGFAGAIVIHLPIAATSPAFADASWADRQWGSNGIPNASVGCVPSPSPSRPDCGTAGRVADMIDARHGGARGDGVSDDTGALQAAFDQASRTNRAVWLAPGDYLYREQLKIDGVRVVGAGAGSRLVAAEPTQQRILMTGQAPELACVQILYHDLERKGSDHGRKGVMVQDATDFQVRNVFFNGQGFDKAPKFGGGALFIYRSSKGRVLNNRFVYTAADSIHITGGSTDILVQGNRIEYSGDDGVAVVNYGNAVRNNIVILDNTILNNRWGRNISAVGGQDIRILNNHIAGNLADGAGIYIASEKAYKTAGPERILVQDNTIEGTGGPRKRHGQIMLWTGNDNPVGEVVVRNNTIRDSKKKDLAIVVSNRVNNVVLDSNRADGETTLRGDAEIEETGGGNKAGARPGSEERKLNASCGG